MQIRKVFLFGALAAAAVLLTAPAVVEAGPFSCKTSDGNWTVTLDGTTATSCPSGGSCVKADYTVQGTLTPQNVVALFPNELVNVVSDNPNGLQLGTPGDSGDPQFGLGRSDITTTWVKIDSKLSVVHYSAYLNMQDFVLIERPVIVKYGNKGASAISGTCAIGVPEESSDNPLRTQVSDTYEVIGGKCKIHAHTNPQTHVTTVNLVPNESDPKCSVSDPIPPDQMTMSINGTQDVPLLLHEGHDTLLIVGNGTCGWKQFYATRGNWYYICW